MEIIGLHSKSAKCDWLRHSLWELTDHPPYTHYLAHNDFHPLRSIPYDNLAGKELATEADKKQAANSRLETLDTYSFHAGMQALVPRWDKCLNVSGEYVEVWCVPCATHVLRKFINRSRNKVLDIEVFVTWLLNSFAIAWS